MADTPHQVINRYLEDTIAAERNFESALSSFGKAVCNSLSRICWHRSLKRRKRSMSG